MKHIARLFILAGILFYAFGLYNIYLRENPGKLSFDYLAVAQKQAPKEKNLPTKVTINAVGIDLPIYETGMKGNEPATIENGASYFNQSPLPGEKGNSIIYAHNWNNLFGPLVSVKPGDEVNVTYADGSTKKFEIEYVSVVAPSESTIVAPSKDVRITLYTCTGFLDSKRFVAVAVLKS